MTDGQLRSATEIELLQEQRDEARRFLSRISVVEMAPVSSVQRQIQEAIRMLDVPIKKPSRLREDMGLLLKRMDQLDRRLVAIFELIESTQ